MLELEKISGFRSLGEFMRFTAFLEEHVTTGELQEIPADPDYHAGEIYGGRWFRVTHDGSVWRLIPPDPPFAGLFERTNQLRLASSKS